VKKIKKLSLKKITIQQLEDTSGGYLSYGYACSGSCSSCRQDLTCGTGYICWLTQGGCSPI
jgi:hypothetical protein